MRKPFITATRKLATKAIKERPVTIRGASVKAFPIVFDTIVNTHDIRTSVTGFVELEFALLSYEIAIIATSVASKKLSKNHSNTEDP